MRVGVPKEIKVHEYRVGLTPASVAELVAAGHEVIVETKAGLGIDFSDQDYVEAGATHRRRRRRGLRRVRHDREGEGAAGAARSPCSSRATCSSPISTSPPTPSRPRA